MFLDGMPVHVVQEQAIQLRKSEERGKADHGWLKTRYSFSFADYYDPAHMHFRALRVINEDWIAPKKGFNTHPHRNMEILTYVLSGVLEHRDTMGNQSQIHAGEFQLMSAGKGVEHSEFSGSEKEAAHLLQIWILPEKKDLEPSYQQKSFAHHDQGLKKVASPDGADNSLQIHQDATVYLGRFATAQKVDYPLAVSRHAWIQVIKGKSRVHHTELQTGDGLQISGERQLVVEAAPGSELLLFDLH
jgi:redox-sensitive bicupin YhaK (pirin superfamily)